MKNGVFIFVIMLCLGLQGVQAQEWIWQNPLPQGNTLHALHFVNDQHGWAVGEAGTIVHTYDGGTTWTLQESNTSHSLVDVHFSDATNGWAVGPSGFVGMGFVFHTTDGGATWMPVEPDPDGAWQAVHFADVDHGWLAGEQTISRTSDGGQAWTAVNLNGSFFLNDLYFIDAQTGWAVGSQGVIYHTTDGGETWAAQASSTANDLNAVLFLDAVTGWAVGRSGTVLHTTDGGVNWTAQNGGLPAFFTDVHFTDANHGWISTHERLADGTAIRVTTDGGATWNTVVTGATFDLRGVHFADDDIGWITGVAGEILRTDDGGVTWMPQTEGPRNTFWDVAASIETILAIGPSDYLYYTLDGGTSWLELPVVVGKTQDLEEDCEIWVIEEDEDVLEDRFEFGIILMQSCSTYGFTAHSHTKTSGAADVPKGKPGTQQDLDIELIPIDFGVAVELHGAEIKDSLSVWVVGDQGTILHSTDAGTTWVSQASGVSTRLEDLFFIDLDQGWIVGDDGIILHTTDSGQTWTSQTSGSNTRLRAVYFADAETGWAIGNSGTILHTTNGGQTWIRQTSGTAFRLYDIDFGDDYTGWIVGDQGTILHSTDRGLTWNPVPSVTTNALLGVDFIDVDTGWISGEGGTILKYTGSGDPTAAEDRPTDDLVSKFLLAQNYPNPFNPQTTIPFSVPQSGHVQIQVFDVLGRLIETLVDQDFAPGTYSRAWNASSVPSGVYVYRMQTGQYVENKTMVVIR